MNEPRKKIRIAIIDSGINQKLSNLKNNVILSTGFEIDRYGYIKENSDIPVRNLHGTIIAMIIRHICSDVEFVSVNILDENLLTDGRILAYALSRIFDYQPDMIHMSLGTLKKRYIIPLKKIVREAKKYNIQLVAAAEITGKISYPAHLKGVFGVKADLFDDCTRYSYQNSFFYAPSDTYGIECIQAISDVSTASGTSMSAAYMSGHIANILKNNHNISYKNVKEALLQKMKEESII